MCGVHTGSCPWLVVPTPTPLRVGELSSFTGSCPKFPHWLLTDRFWQPSERGNHSPTSQVGKGKWNDVPWKLRADTRLTLPYSIVYILPVLSLNMIKTKSLKLMNILQREFCAQLWNRENLIFSLQGCWCKEYSRIFANNLYFIFDRNMIFSLRMEKNAVTSFLMNKHAIVYLIN